jgi:hypothetical protein
MEQKAEMTRNYQPDAQECAILLLLLVSGDQSGEQREISRVRLAEITLKRLWGRHRLTDDFLAEVQEWLFRAGWALFYAGTTFAMVKTKAVEGWPRVSSKRLRDKLEDVAHGEFDFDRYFDLLEEHRRDSDEE